jgi:alpha-beta hydrolase superfamily lysophospholipase
MHTTFTPYPPPLTARRRALAAAILLAPWLGLAALILGAPWPLPAAILMPPALYGASLAALNTRRPWEL